MIRNKYIILPFLLFAWTIIFAHSIIPHHHHSGDVHSECSHCYTHLENLTSYNDCGHDCTDHACHFHVDVLTKVNIDNNFIASAENTYSNYSLEINSGKIVSDIAFFSDQIPKTNYLRGPPIRS